LLRILVVEKEQAGPVRRTPQRFGEKIKKLIQTSRPLAYANADFVNALAWLSSRPRVKLLFLPRSGN